MNKHLQPAPPTLDRVTVGSNVGGSDLPAGCIEGSDDDSSVWYFGIKTE